MRIRRSIAAIVGIATVLTLMPRPSLADDACSVLADPGGHVTGPLGTARPTPDSGREIDLTGVTMQSDPVLLNVSIQVADLSAKPTDGTSGAFYATFWSVGFNRYFAQASRVNGTWFFEAGPAAGESLPQQGQQITGIAAVKQNMVTLNIPRSSLFGADQLGAVLEQVRASSEESTGGTMNADQGVAVNPVVVTQDRIGGPDGGRFRSDAPCLPEISGAGERCLVAVNPPHAASSGAVPTGPTAPEPSAPMPSGVPALVQGPTTPQLAVGSIDSATTINSVQMGSNPGTLIIEIGVGSLANPIPQGADAERWTVTWNAHGKAFTAYAERHAQGNVFQYNDGVHAWVTTGSIDTSSATVRILVPRHEIGADTVLRLTSVFAQSAVIIGPAQDVRDSAPATQVFSTQFIVGLSCGDQEKAACPVVFDPSGEATASANNAQTPDAENQPASDILSVGAAAPSDSMVFSVKVGNLGPGPSDGATTQGWTVSWSYGGTRYVAQAEREGSTTKFFSAAVGPASSYPAPAHVYSLGSTKQATGNFDPLAQTISIVVPRADIGTPSDGEQLTELGARAWVASPQQVSGRYPPYRQYAEVDTTQVAPYRVGLACSA